MYQKHSLRFIVEFLDTVKMMSGENGVRKGNGTWKYSTSDPVITVKVEKTHPSQEKVSRVFTEVNDVCFTLKYFCKSYILIS